MSATASNRPRLVALVQAPDRPPPLDRVADDISLPASPLPIGLPGRVGMRESIRRCYLAGCLLSVEDGDLRISAERLSPEDRSAIDANARGIVALLVAYGVGQVDGYGLIDGAVSAPKRYAVPSDCLGRAACCRLGWCGRALDGRRCGPAARKD